MIRLGTEKNGTMRFLGKILEPIIGLFRPKKYLCCPRCRRRFSDWFVIHKHHGPLAGKATDILRYCYTCPRSWNETEVSTEKIGVWLTEKEMTEWP